MLGVGLAFPGQRDAEFLQEAIYLFLQLTVPLGEGLDNALLCRRPAAIACVGLDQVVSQAQLEVLLHEVVPVLGRHPVQLVDGQVAALGLALNLLLQRRLGCLVLCMLLLPQELVDVMCDELVLLNKSVPEIIQQRPFRALRALSPAEGSLNAYDLSAEHLHASQLLVAIRTCHHEVFEQCACFKLEVVMHWYHAGHENFSDRTPVPFFARSTSLLHLRSQYRCGEQDGEQPSLLQGFLSLELYEVVV